MSLYCHYPDNEILMIKKNTSIPIKKINESLSDDPTTNNVHLNKITAMTDDTINSENINYIKQISDILEQLITCHKVLLKNTEIVNDKLNFIINKQQYQSEYSDKNNVILLEKKII